MSALKLQEVDKIEIQVIITDELDVLSPSPHPEVQAISPMRSSALGPIDEHNGRHGTLAELKMEQICCGAFGLSLMIVSFPRILPY